MMKGLVILTDRRSLLSVNTAIPAGERLRSIRVIMKLSLRLKIRKRAIPITLDLKKTIKLYGKRNVGKSVKKDVEINFPKAIH